MQKKLVRLCQDTFVRRYSDVAYAMNQLTTADRLLDESGAIFLGALSRAPQEESAIADRIAAQFEDVQAEELRADLETFLEELAADGFILRGNSEAELDAAEPSFLYSNIQQIMDAKHALSAPLDADGNSEFTDTQIELTQRFSDKPILYNLQVELTSACNERCIHCYLPPQRNQQHADVEMVKRLINEFADMGGVTFTFGGGECMLHPNFSELLEHARSRDLSVSVLTNLTKLNDDLLASLKAARISQLQVSVYSMDPAEHDHITQASGSLARTLAAVERLVAANVPVQVSCPVMKTNYRSFKHVLEWAQSHGMKAQTDFIMMARCDFSTDNLSERIDDEQTIALLTDMLDVDRLYKEIVTDSPQPVNTSETPVCGVGRSTLTVGANGTLFPCAGWQGMKVGNAMTHSLAQIWEESLELRLLRNITKGDFPECLTCPDREYCAMCLVRNFNESGGDMMRLPRRFCEVARLNRLVVEKWKAAQKEIGNEQGSAVAS